MNTLFSGNANNLSTVVSGIKFKNPVLVASGTFGYGNEINDLIDPSKLGGIITKTITLKPKMGNPPPRLVETASGLLNSIGLQNVGLDVFLSEKSSSIKKFNIPIIVSIAGESSDDYVNITKRLSKEKWVSAIELNLSCPNLNKKIIGKDAKLIKGIVEDVKRAASVPIFVKLSPEVNSLSDMALIAEKSGADAISLVNTFPGLAIDIKTLKPKLANIVGGLSGPAIKPLALKCVWDVARAVKIPIIGGGGITTGTDALEFLACGASLVTVGTANLIDTNASIRIIEEMKVYMKQTC